MVSDPFTVFIQPYRGCEHVDEATIPKRVDADTRLEAILTQDAALPLRSSGPLMLGVVRIYSRKVGYLFDDCKEARERISLVSLNRRLF